MKNSVSRDTWGKIQGGLSYFWNNEDESYKDEKIRSENVRFPQYKGNLNGDCVTYDISLLKNN